MRERGHESGQASVELVALLPLLAAVVLGSWQVVVAAQSWWLAGTAAQAASRAVTVGADPQAAARGALPQGWARRVRVSGASDGEVTVRVAIPLVAGGARLADASVRVGLAGAVGRRASTQSRR